MLGRLSIAVDTRSSTYCVSVYKCVTGPTRYLFELANQRKIPVYGIEGFGSPVRPRKFGSHAKKQYSAVAGTNEVETLPRSFLCHQADRKERNPSIAILSHHHATPPRFARTPNKSSPPAQNETNRPSDLISKEGNRVKRLFSSPTTSTAKEPAELHLPHTRKRKPDRESSSCRGVVPCYYYCDRTRRRRRRLNLTNTHTHFSFIILGK